MKSNPFSSNNYYLGSTTDVPLGVDDINQLFSTPKVVPTPCYICGNPAEYRLVPYNGQPLTAEIESRGYVCGGCINKKLVDSNRFTLKTMDGAVVPGGRVI